MHELTEMDSTVGMLAVVWTMARVVERAVEVKVPAVDLAGSVLDDMVSFFCIELV